MAFDVTLRNKNAEFSFYFQKLHSE